MMVNGVPSPRDMIVLPMGLEPILGAIRAGDTNAVETQLAEHPDLIRARTPEGISLVMMACYHGKRNVVAQFVGCGATLDIFDASAAGDKRRVQLLAERFPESIEAYAPDGFFPLALASYFGHLGGVAYLLDRGADVNQVADNPVRIAPIHAAVSNRHADTVRLLLEGKTAADIALERSHTDIVSLLHEKPVI